MQILKDAKSCQELAERMTFSLFSKPLNIVYLEHRITQQLLENLCTTIQAKQPQRYV